MPYTAAFGKPFQAQQAGGTKNGADISSSAIHASKPKAALANASPAFGFVTARLPPFAAHLIALRAVRSLSATALRRGCWALPKPTIGFHPLENCQGLSTLDPVFGFPLPACALRRSPHRPADGSLALATALRRGAGIGFTHARQGMKPLWKPAKGFQPVTRVGVGFVGRYPAPYWFSKAIIRARLSISFRN